MLATSLSPSGVTEAVVPPPLVAPSTIDPSSRQATDGVANKAKEMVFRSISDLRAQACSLVGSIHRAREAASAEREADVSICTCAAGPSLGEAHMPTRHRVRRTRQPLLRWARAL